MQIQNNYNSYSGTEYRNSHTHHITECLYDHEEKPQSGSASAGSKSSLSHQETDKKEEAEQILFHENNSGVKKPETGLGKGMGLLKQVWDSMGDENQGAEKGAAAMGENRTREDSSQGIIAASSAIRHLIPSYITEKWESVKDKVKAKAGAAFQRFDKKKDAFLALSSPGGRFRGKKEEKQKRQERTGRGTRRSRPEILSATLSDTHLTDSYSKTGEYCKLGENLSHRQQRREANRKMFSE